MASQSLDNVIRVAFDGPATQAEPATENHREVRAIQSCLRYLQDQAARNEQTTAAHLIGAAAEALADDLAEES